LAKQRGWSWPWFYSACAPGAAELFLAEPTLKPHQITGKSYRSKVDEKMANAISGLLSQAKEMGKEGFGTFWFSMSWQG